MKKLFGMIALLGLLACNHGGKEVVPKTETDRSFYAVGAMFGQRLADLLATDAEFDMVVQGLRDAHRGKADKVDLQEHRKKVGELFRERAKIRSEKLKKEGVAYIEKFVKEGATKSESGMAWKIVKQGEGKVPKADSVVRAHYHGTLIDGQVFDSSVERGQPVNFPLNRVIKCWTEGMQKVKKGGKIKLACPSSVAYGDGGAPPKIPGGATLLFEVELLDILPPSTGSGPSKRATSKRKKKRAKKKKK